MPNKIPRLYKLLLFYLYLYIVIYYTLYIIISIQILNILKKESVDTFCGSSTDFNRLRLYCFL